MDRSLEKVRVSIGSAIVLRLMKGRLDAEPSTAYLLTFHEGKCSANCSFCPQAKNSKSKADMLSRVIWPSFRINDVLTRLQLAVSDGRIKRVCIQALNYKNTFNDLVQLVKYIHSNVKYQSQFHAILLRKGR